MIYDPWVKKINLNSQKVKLAKKLNFKNDIIIFTVAHKILKINLAKINQKTKIFDLNNCLTINQLNEIKQKKIKTNILGRN